MATLADWRTKLAKKLSQKLGAKKTDVQNKLKKTERDEKKEKEGEGRKIRIFGITLKKWFYLFLLSLIGKILAALACIGGMLALLGAVLLVVVMIVMLLLQAFTILLSNNYEDWFNNTHDQEAGEHYVFSMQDYSLLPSMYLKNMYVQAWLLTNAKDALGSSASVPYMMGINNYEYGPKFFRLYDADYEDYSITEYLCGASNLNSSNLAQGIYQWLLNNGGSSFYPSVYNSVFSDTYTVDKVWGDIPHLETLKDDVIVDNGYAPLWTQYGNTGSLDNSPWNIAVSVGAMVSNYEKYAVTSLDKDMFKGHAYKKFYEAACKRQKLDPNDAGVKNWVSSSIYYLVHAGGAWTNNMTESVYDAWGYASFDYLVYAYRMYPDIALSEDYHSVKAMKSLSVVDLKASALGTQISQANSAGKSFNTSFAITDGGNVMFAKDGVVLQKTLMQGWYDSLPGDYKHYADDFGAMYTYYSYSGGTQIGSGNRQAAYAVGVAPTMMAIGNMKLNLIFDSLGREFVIDSQGYVCNPKAEESGNGNGTNGGSDVPNGAANGEFSAGLRSMGSNGHKYSNIRDSSWFVTLDNSEWSNPLSPTTSGGFRVSSRYGWRQLNGGWDWHAGMDMVYKSPPVDATKWNPMCPVYAMHDGKVTRIKDYYDSAGKYITYSVSYMRNGVKVTRYITYMHMSEIDKKEGDTVKKGELIGYMGNSGGLYALHLHMQIGVLDRPNGKPGLLDIETELPFVTQYAGYHAWDNGVGYSGYLAQAPDPNISSGETDPNYRIRP